MGLRMMQGPESPKRRAGLQRDHYHARRLLILTVRPKGIVELCKPLLSIQMVISVDMASWIMLQALRKVYGYIWVVYYYSTPYW